ncbi:MAG: hypothetical protein HY348_00915 [Nitrospira defluvii]|nr:hypothetical protein [Nitrospira defluvii]
MTSFLAGTQNQAYVIEGVVEAHFAAVTLTVTAIRKAPHRREAQPAFCRLVR